ncbi:FecR family protein [Leptospira ilyithenensis]|uniref:Iron dicitrate transport regulator FecR n=1 Tax=Leptospira ilyithenensis TaxID=2484901 RepID=A0A4R9LSD8_9LEPT|nr:FecR family protein [Leptospira ilyithenensis]TGN14315.1 iron dicitrate transport regulator FecR [Leptospira ilyithenensis]
MKLILSPKKFTLVFVAIFAIFSLFCQKDSKTSNPEAQVERAAVFAFIKGDVVLLREGNQIKPSLGDALVATDTVVTGANGAAEILLGEDGVLKLAKNTSLSVNSALKGRAEERNTEVNLQYGKLVTVLRKERKSESFYVITSTSIAGVRGTSFLTSVENPSSKSGSVPCSQSNCVVKYTVLDGAIAIKKSNSENELVLDKQKKATVGPNSKLSEKLVEPLDSQSLGELKEMLVFENTKMLEFESLSDELRSNNEVLKQMDAGFSLDEVETSVRRKEATRNKSDEVITTAKSIEESKYIQKDVQKDSLKLPAKEGFDKTR